MLSSPPGRRHPRSIDWQSSQLTTTLHTRLIDRSIQALHTHTLTLLTHHQSKTPNQDLYYLGDFGPDFVAAARWFVLTFFHANGIATTWVHDGSFNPAKVSTQQSRYVVDDAWRPMGGGWGWDRQVWGAHLHVYTHTYIHIHIQAGAAGGAGGGFQQAAVQPPPIAAEVGGLLVGMVGWVIEIKCI